MGQHTHQTAPTQFVDAVGIRFAYRRFGKSTGVPLVLNMHFTGTMDHWDPAVTDGFAATREVILFNNAGISSTSGEMPTSVEEMAATRGGDGMATLTPEAQAVFAGTYKNPDEVWLGVFFTPTEASQAAGRAFLRRFRLRVQDRDPEVGEKVAPAQINAIGKRGCSARGRV
jgi:hypothetical protein